MVREPEKTDWRADHAGAERDGNFVKPIFSVKDPQGKEQGSAEGENRCRCETWAAATPDLLQQVAAEAAPRIGAVLTGIRVAHDKADPEQPVQPRRPRSWSPDVTGAPGDGDQSLTQQMRARLAVLGPVVLTTASGRRFRRAGSGQGRADPEAAGTRGDPVDRQDRGGR